jgi:hypothetical protein
MDAARIIVRDCRAPPKCAGSSAGSTQRVTQTATARPLMVNSPSCAKPSKLDSNIAENPQIEVRTPSRSVGQIRSNVRSTGLSGAVWVNR